MKRTKVLRSQLKDVKTELESVQSQLETTSIQVSLLATVQQLDSGFVSV